MRSMSFRLHDIPDARRKTWRALWGKEGNNKANTLYSDNIDPYYKVLAIAMGLVSLLTLLIPEAAKLSGTFGYPYYLVIIR